MEPPSPRFPPGTYQNYAEDYGQGQAQWSRSVSGPPLHSYMPVGRGSLHEGEFSESVTASF